MTRRDIVTYRLPAEFEGICGSAPVLTTEDPKAYNRLFDAVAQALRPQDIIELLVVDDIVYLSWKSRRYRKIISELIDESRKAVAKSNSGQLKDDPLLRKVPVWLKAADDICPEYGEVPPKCEPAKPPPLEPESPLGPISEGLRDNLDLIERMDKLSALTERRRSQALASLESYRTSIALRAREVSQQIIEGEFDDANTDPGEGGPKETGDDVRAKD